MMFDTINTYCIVTSNAIQTKPNLIIRETENIFSHFVLYALHNQKNPKSLPFQALKKVELHQESHY